VAPIQIIKADPQMVNLIHNIPSANDGEHKDNDNNIIKYIETNKNRLLNLTEKNYENLVEALTNNSISSVAASSLSNPASSLPQSSLSTFPGPSNKIATYRIEEPETYRNSEGDIAE